MNNPLKKNNDRQKSLDDVQNLIATYGKQIHNTRIETLMPFDQFLFRASHKPEKTFRDIFQLFFDMVNHDVPEGFDEYPVTKDSAGFLNYQMNNLLVDGCTEPFYADRIFANRFMSVVNSFKKGVQNNQIYFFEGPPGSGKSTFLNNLLEKFELYTQSPEGAMFKIAWVLKLNDLPGYNISGETTDLNELVISCPNNDHPITLIPVHLRKSFLEELIQNKEFKQKLNNSKEFEWVFKQTPCAFCRGMFNQLMTVYKESSQVMKRVYARRMEFSRHFGKGVSIFNPGDPPVVGAIENRELQQNLNRLFSTDEVSYLHSYLAYTNNGILALMDIKDKNKERLMNLHGIVSDGVHKVNHIEERIRSLFLGVINPEDTSTYENVQSFKDRIVTIRIPYVLDYTTEVSIWQHKFGNKVIDAFMPRTLTNFAKLIISSRMLTNTTVFDNWLKTPEKYKNYIDENLLLLKMELYIGKIPKWLDDADISNFKKETRKRIISDTEFEGKSGISGRQSLNLFNKFISKYDLKTQEINMLQIMEFIRNESSLKNAIPAKFSDALFNLYEYNILDELKDAVYFYNETKMKRDLKNYLYALNFEKGENVRSHYTGDVFELNDEFYNSIEPFIYGDTTDIEVIEKLRTQEHLTYITQTLTKEIRMNDIPIEQTEQFLALLRKYQDNLKESVLAPFENNDHFKRCVQAYNTQTFNKFETKLKKTVNRIIENLIKNSGYTEESAQYIIIYVLENKLNERFKNFGIN